MRLHRGVPMLAAVFTLVGTSAPAASGYIRTSVGGPSGQPAVVTHHSSGDSTDWLVGIGALGGLAVFGTGLTAKRSGARKQQHNRMAPGA
jgi:hypothetical protein